MRAAKVDANQSDIVGELEQAFYDVDLLHMVGRGIGDIMVSHLGLSAKYLGSPFGIICVVELKTEEKYNAKYHSLTPAQMIWHEKKRGWKMIACSFKQIHTEYIAGLQTIAESIILESRR